MPRNFVGPGVSEDLAPPWIARQLAILLAQRGHAWLLQGPSGLGQYRLALELVRAWLCLAPTQGGACGQCGSCHAIDVHTHADLFMLMPETGLLERGWPLAEKAQAEIDDKKRKPSREIRIDAMRDAIEFSQRTSAGDRGKAVLVFPAERMNPITANALLKTLEEPAGGTRFVLASEAAQQLLPTIRSRCQAHAMEWPVPTQVQAWLVAQGVGAAEGAIWLGAAGGRPDDALDLARSGRDAGQWDRLPKALRQGEGAELQGWPPHQLLAILHKVCHDMQLHQQGARPRYFRPQDLPAAASLKALSHWGRALTRAARTVEHPFNPGLMQEALLSQARIALNSTD